MAEPTLDINVVATRGPSGPTAWLAEVADYNSPFVGLFVFGPTFSVARAALASTIWAAVVATPDLRQVGGVDLDQVAYLNLLTVTRKLFPVGSFQGRSPA
jgi:hypothetical protein